jgi:hypothetical protein
MHARAEGQGRALRGRDHHVAKAKFKDGKATEATVNWGQASAPLLIYPLIYAGTGLDNSTNVLGPEVVRLVNGFATKKCAELKAELPAGKPN